MCLDNNKEFNAHAMKGSQEKRKRGIPESSNQDPAEGNDLGCKTTKVSKSAADAPIGVSEDNQSLSAGTDGNRLSAAEEIRESSFGAVDSGNTDAAETPVHTQADSSPTVEAGPLPFAKKSPMWKSVESMEVYRARPQRPHFCDLLNDKKEHREGTALGMMVTFAGLMERIGSLEFDEPSEELNSIKDSLLGFEKNGFDVQAPLTQVEKLNSIKFWVEKTLKTWKQKEKEIDALDSKIENYDEAMEEVKKKINELEEQFASIKSKKDGVDNEKQILESLAERMFSDVQSHQSRFRDIADAFGKGNSV